MRNLLATLSIQIQGFLVAYPVLQDGLKLTAVALGWQMVQAFWKFVSGSLMSEFTSTASVQEHDMAYQWLLHFLTLHVRDHTEEKPTFWAVLLGAIWPSGNKTPTHVAVQTRWMKGYGEMDEAHVLFRPSSETPQYIHFKGKTIKIRSVQISEGMEAHQWFFMSTFLGSTALFKDFIAAARMYYNNKDRGQLRILLPDRLGGLCWRNTDPRPARRWDSVILPKCMKDNLLYDVMEFLREEKFYRERGQPWRRGYMLYGLPGTGKSSMIAALASTLDVDLYNLSLSASWMDDSALTTLINDMSGRSILLMEDIDCALRDREEDKDSTNDSNEKDKKQNGTKKEREKSRVTLSGLLNALDGVAASEGRLLFCTTNHLDRIDPAIKRAGRCDVLIEFKHTTKEQIRELFLHFYASRPPSIPPTPEDTSPEISDEKKLLLSTLALTPPPTPSYEETINISELADKFAADIPVDSTTSSALQGYMMRYKRRPVEAVAGVKAWVEAGFPQLPVTVSYERDMETLSE